MYLPKLFGSAALLSLLGLSLLPNRLAAQIWQGGGGDNNLSNGANWAEGMPPASGTNADVTFASGTGMINDTGAAFSLQSAYFYGIGGPFTISGSPLVFSGTAFVANSSNFIARFSSDVTLGAPLNLGGAGFLVFDGAVTDPSNYGLNVSNTYVTELAGSFQLGTVTTQNASYLAFTGNGTITGGVFGTGSALIGFGGDATKTRTIVGGASLNAPSGLIQFQGGTTRFDGYVFVGPADFDFVGGTVDGTGQIDFNLAPTDVFTFGQGALLGDGTQTSSVNGGFFQINGVVGTQTIGRELIVRSPDVRFVTGDVQLTGAGRLTIDGTTAQVRNSDFKMTGASTANELRLNNGAVLQKTTGSGGGVFSLGATLNLGNGSLQVDAGSVRLNAGSVLPATSTINLAFITELDFAGGTQLFNSPSMVGEGGLVLSGGTLVTDPTASVSIGSVIGSVELRGGTLSGGQNTLVSPATSWNASTLTTTFATPAVATTNVPAFLALTGSTSRTLDRRSIFASGGGIWIGGDLVMSGGNAANPAVFSLTGTGGIIFRIQSDQSVLPGPGGNAIFNISSGNRLLKEVSSGTTTFAVPFSSSGGLEATAGRILLTGGTAPGGITGGINLSNGAILEFGGGSFNLNFPTWLGSGGNAVVSGANTVVQPASGSSIGNFQTKLDLLDGTLTGISFNLTGSETNWGATRLTTTLAAPAVAQTNLGGPLALVGDANHLLDRRTLYVSNGGRWTGQGDLVLNGGDIVTPALFSLTGSGNVAFRAQTDRSILPGVTAPGAFVVNSGNRFIKELTSGTTTVAVPVFSSGGIEVNAGRLLLSAGSYNNGIGGALTITTGATLEFGGGSFALNFPSWFGTGGAVVVSGASTFVQPGAGAQIGNFQTRFDLLDGTLTGVGFTLNANAVNWGATRLTTNLPPPLLAQSPVNGALNLVGDVNHLLDRRTLFLSVGGTWTGQGDLVLNGGDSSNVTLFSLVGSGNVAFRAQNDRSILPGATATGALVVNGGNRFVKEIATGTTTVAVPVLNAGGIEVNAGRLLLSAGTYNTGLGGGLTIASGATLEFGGGTFALNFPSWFGTGGAVVVSGSGTTVQPGAGAQIGNFQTRLDLVDGTLTGVGFTLNGSPVNWGATRLTTTLSAPQVTQTPLNGALNLVGDANHVLDRRTLFVGGGGTWTGQGDLVLNSGDSSNVTLFSLVGSGNVAFRAQTDRSILPGATASGALVVNGGNRFLKETTSGTTTVAVPVLNAGGIEVNSGRLLLTGGSYNTGLGGGLTVASGATLEFGGGTFALNFPSWFGTGGAVVVSGAGTIVQPASGAALGNFQTRLDLNDGTVTGTSFSLNGSAIHWGATRLTTTLAAPSVATANVGGPLNLVGSANHVLDRRSLALPVGGTWTGTGDLILNGGDASNPVTFALFAGGPATFRMQTDRSILYGAVPSANVQIIAGNRLVKELSTGTSTIEPCLQNSGTLEVASGTLRLTATCSVNNGLLLASSGGTLRVEGNVNGSGNVTVDSGGTLTLQGGIYNSGQISISGLLDLRGGVLGNGSNTTTIQAGGRATGAGSLYGTIVNNGTISSTETIAFTGPVTNNGVMRFRAGGRAQFYGPTFVNNGILDLITGSLDLYNGTVLVNNGVVLDSSVVKVKRTTVAGNQVNVVVDGYAEHVFQLQYSPDLTTPFANLGAPQTGTGGELTFTDGLNGARGFYRVVVDPTMGGLGN